MDVVGLAAEPYRLQCPNGHSNWEPIDGHFWCESCEKHWDDTDGTFQRVVDAKTGDELDREAVRELEDRVEEVAV
jgi:hypothetical protein